MNAFFFTYRWLVWPLLRGVFEVLARFNTKIAKGLELREEVDGRFPWVKLLPPQPPTVWIHAASGEFEYAKPVITLLKKHDISIVVSYFSPTYADNIRKFSGVDWVVPLPWDSPRPLQDFLDSYRPFALLVARTDVWPEMARQTKLRGMKTALFSATLTPNSGRSRGLGKWATRATLSQLDKIFCVTDEDRKTFESIGLTNVEQQGDTRYDQVLARLSQPKPVNEAIFAAISKDLLVCGSTWPQDEAVLIPALAQLDDVTGCLVPHEPTPEHIAHLEREIRAHGLTPVRYSAPHGLDEPKACLIVDQVGILAELYLKGRWAFVGGSFRKTVHSVMEPLAAGCVTFVGPLHTNNREAIAFQDFKIINEIGYVTQVNDAGDLIEKIRALKTAGDTKEQIREAVRARTGSSRALVTWLVETRTRDEVRG